jgi:hypothetical protein
MTGRLYIDGNDAYSLYRVFIYGDEYNELLSFPQLKKVASNNWPEEDGEEFDLSSPVLASRELNIRFGFHSPHHRFGGFLEMLSDGAYHDFDFQTIGRSYKLRLVQQPNLSMALHLGIFSLRFADDFPLEGYDYVPPQSAMTQTSGYELDERDLADYGIIVTAGSKVEIEKMPAVKKNLLTDIGSQSGVIYDGEYVFFQTKDVKLNCLMRAGSLTDLWRNYNALLYDLSRPGERKLYADSTGYEYPCMYRSISVKNFRGSGKIWLEFTLTLLFTSFRLEGEEVLLASEDAMLIITEDEDNAIDLLQ